MSNGLIKYSASVNAEMYLHSHCCVKKWYWLFSVKNNGSVIPGVSIVATASILAGGSCSMNDEVMYFLLYYKAAGLPEASFLDCAEHFKALINNKVLQQRPAVHVEQPSSVERLQKGAVNINWCLGQKLTWRVQNRFTQSGGVGLQPADACKQPKKIELRLVGAFFFSSGGSERKQGEVKEGRGSGSHTQTHTHTRSTTVRVSGFFSLLLQRKHSGIGVSVDQVAGRSGGVATPPRRFP